MNFSPSKRAFYPNVLRKDYERAGSWPSDAVEVSQQEYKAFLSKPPEGRHLGADENGRPIWVPTSPASIEELAAHQRSAIDISRDAAFAAGLVYDIAGESDVVQTRPQDQINLLGLSAKAQLLIADGVTDSVMPFRGLSNVTRSLTPQDMSELALAALAHIEGIYQQSWGRKDSIDAILSNDTLDDSEKRLALESIFK